MRRNTLHIIAGAMLLGAMTMATAQAQAQGRRPTASNMGGRPAASMSAQRPGGNMSRSESRSMSSPTRSSEHRGSGGVSSSNRGGSSQPAVTRRDNRPTASHWPGSASTMGNARRDNTVAGQVENRRSGNYSTRPGNSNNSGSGNYSGNTRNDRGNYNNGGNNNRGTDGNGNYGGRRPGGNDRGGNNYGNNDRGGNNHNRGNNPYYGNNDRGNNYNRGGNNDRGGNYNRGGNNDRGGNNNRGGNNDRGGNYNRGGNNNRGGNTYNYYNNNYNYNYSHNGGNRHGVNHGGPRPDYDRYRYNNNMRPRHHHDRFFTHYRYNSWSWRNPVMPPVRHYRPHHVWFYRPVRPVGFTVYASAPIITGILGVEFGTRFDSSLNYLYYNGYEIDGYYDNVVYLRDVPLYDYTWPDVMMQYDDRGLAYAQFSYSCGYDDRVRFNRLYHDLCAHYGAPIRRSGYNGYFSWYGGNGVGFVNLGVSFTGGRYYTTLSFGI